MTCIVYDGFELAADRMVTTTISALQKDAYECETCHTSLKSVVSKTEKIILGSRDTKFQGSRIIAMAFSGDGEFGHGVINLLNANVDPGSIYMHMVTFSVAKYLRDATVLVVTEDGAWILACSATGIVTKRCDPDRPVFLGPTDPARFAMYSYKIPPRLAVVLATCIVSGVGMGVSYLDVRDPDRRIRTYEKDGSSQSRSVRQTILASVKLRSPKERWKPHVGSFSQFDVLLEKKD